jgi:hypothetical protein
MLEGSENPLAETFEEKEYIEWSILSGNTWIDLSNSMLQNDSKNSWNPEL